MPFKAGSPCPRCGGQVLARWETDMEGRGGLERRCMQCGYEADVPQPTPEEMAQMKKATISEGMSHHGMPTHRLVHHDGQGHGPEMYLCKRPGCGTWRVSTRQNSAYCSTACWYAHRVILNANKRPQKAFWRGP